MTVVLLLSLYLHDGYEYDGYTFLHTKYSITRFHSLCTLETYLPKRLTYHLSSVFIIFLKPSLLVFTQHISLNVT